MPWKDIELEEIYERMIQITRTSESIQGGRDQIVQTIKSIYDGLEVPALIEVHPEKLNQQFARWIGRLLLKEPLPDGIRSLYFGLFEALYVYYFFFRERCIELYVSGSRELPAAKNWTCENSYWPNGRYSKIFIDNKIYKSITKIAEPIEFELNILVLGTLAMLLIKFNARLMYETVRKDLWIGCGFDAGDTFILGKLSAQGIDLSQMKATGYFIDLKPLSLK